MDHPRKRRDRREKLQNVAITLLTVSAVLLFTQTQLYNLSSSNSYFRQFFSGEPAVSAAENTAAASTVSAPVRVAVSGAYGRYGSVSLTMDDDACAPLKNLLGEALGSAGALSVCDREDFFSALSGVGVYYDFFSSLPLSILGELTGIADSGESVSARYLVVSADAGETVAIHLWDGETYRRCDTAVTQTDLSALVDRYELGGAHFAFDLSDIEGVSPISLFLSPLPQLPVLTAGNPLSSTDALLTALGFNPHTNFRSTESNGTEVIVEGDSTLRIATDGTIRYVSGGAPALVIDAEDGDALTLREAADGAGALLSRLLDGTTGDASPYLREVRQNGGITTLRFDYQAGGVPIRLSSGVAAEITLSGSAVTRIILQFRQYTAGATQSQLLPLRQALAIAATQSGSELSIGYIDNGGASVSAGWLSD